MAHRDTTFNLRITSEEYERIKSAAVAEDVSMATIIRRAVKAFLDRLSKKGA